MSRPPRLSDAEVGQWLKEHSKWTLEGHHLIREFDTIDYASSVKIVEALVSTAEELDHHPIITIGYRHLRFELWTHDQGGLTQLDLDYASALDSVLNGELAPLVN